MGKRNGERKRESIQNRGWGANFLVKCKSDLNYYFFAPRGIVTEIIPVVKESGKIQKKSVRANSKETTCTRFGFEQRRGALKLFLRMFSKMYCQSFIHCELIKAP